MRAPRSGSLVGFLFVTDCDASRNAASPSTYLPRLPEKPDDHQSQTPARGGYSALVDRTLCRQIRQRTTGYLIIYQPR